MDDTIAVPAENRTLTPPAEDLTVVVAGECFVLKVPLMILGSLRHTVGDARKWTVDYDLWLENAAEIASFAAASASTTLTVGTTEIMGRAATFILSGGTLNEQTTVALTMTDSFGNIRNDTIKFTVIAP
jgi:hypothetical protein